MGGWLFLCVLLSLQVVSAGSSQLKCNLGSKMCKDGSECIRYTHVCDGENDCKDGSDEEDCEVKCNEDQFLCAHGKKCIEQSQVCDGVPQCQDSSDERDCVKRMDGCVHQCDNRTRCIPSSFLCDGETDCRDGSDEANCVEEACSEAEFTCSGGQCVSTTVVCDGHPDCWDGSDEEGCTKAPVCTTKHRCPQSQECLVQEWICDGERDCQDGTDEKDCPVAPLTCGDFQWACKSKTECVPLGWRCDRMIDCSDGSDEAECDKETCRSHQFKCGSQECLDPVQVCNGVSNCADGSDEGGSCQERCTDADKERCSQTCYSTPQGTRCGCEAGFRLLEDKVTCEDVDECEAGMPAVCGQLCTNSPGSYQCGCHPGFMMEDGASQCKVTGEPFMLASVQTDLYLYGLRSGSLDVLSSSAKKAILSVDYSWREQKVYWVSLDTESIRWSSLDQKTTGTLIGDVRADSVAVDWLGKNLYWIDGVNSQIVAVRLSTASLKSNELCIILDEDLDQPRSLALLPQKGLMFWTEIGNVVKIERAGMDGSERRAVVNSSLGWPGGVAVDYISERLYWTDERLKAIGSTTLDGNDIRILQMKQTTNPFAVAVFNDMLYWSDAKMRVVQAAHKVTGKKRQVLLKRPKQPFAVKIIHPMIQMGTENPCSRLDCSHLCVLAPERRAVCKCPAGLLLADDKLTCSSLVNSAFLLLLSPSTATQIYLQSRLTATDVKGWPEHLALQLPGVNEATIMDYSLRDRTLFLTDGGTSSLGSFKLKGSVLVSQGQLLRLLADSITAMALDWVALNIYWSSSKQPRLQVTSVAPAHTAVLIKDGIGQVESIAVHPLSGRVCFANVDTQASTATVECASMDGADRRMAWKDAVRPTSLTFSPNGDKIYWADSGNIFSVSIDGSEYKQLVSAEGLAAVALSDSTLLWMTVTDKTRLWFKDEQQRQKLWFEVGTQVVGLKAFSKSSQTGSNKCTDNGNCQHLCLATPKGRTCRCAHDHVAVNSTHCIPERRCPADSLPCLDGLSCQPAEKFCDGHVDCPDHSDENCVGPKQPPRAKASSPRTPLHPSSSPPPPPDSEATEVPEVTGVAEDDVQLLNLEAQQCSQKRCGGNGHCVEKEGVTACVCSPGFSGDSCQGGALDLMRGPVIYGAAGLCAVVVIIAVIAVVVKKKNARNSAAEAAKETSMTDLRNKVETLSSVQTAAADPEKQEEEASVH
ncbi:low-density lipoprotein receptor-related protein 1B [Salarias fasciatus]|uniref:low-density lipoprotein receptor-related protein 1B n=1 Tax=Salarias fasciatus TaxID=181472 RepID=UPI00117654E0|nr:low-density lipoprotein receptor-related protein 1B-like [Salarias fasciatus]